MEVGISDSKGDLLSQEFLGPKCIEEFTRQGPNRYSISSTPPFILFVFDKRANENLGNLHAITFGDKLFEAGIEPDQIAPKGANSFVENDIKRVDPNWVEPKLYSR